MSFASRLIPRSGSAVRGYFLVVLGALALGLGGCEDKHIGRPCNTNVTDAGAAGGGQVAILTSPAWNVRNASASSRPRWEPNRPPRSSSPKGRRAWRRARRTTTALTPIRERSARGALSAPGRRPLGRSAARRCASVTTSSTSPRVASRSRRPVCRRATTGRTRRPARTFSNNGWKRYRPAARGLLVRRTPLRIGGLWAQAGCSVRCGWAPEKTGARAMRSPVSSSTIARKSCPLGSRVAEALVVGQAGLEASGLAADSEPIGAWATVLRPSRT